MSEIRPFRAYRPRPELARDVASLPYDVLSSDEARALARDNPRSFLRVCKPEVDLDPALSPYDDRVYARGRDNLERMIREGTLVRDASPCLYVYQQQMGEHVQAGVVALCSVGEYERGLIKKHELTRPDKEDDRTRHMTETNANPEAMFLAYRAKPALDAVVDSVRSRSPAVDFVAADGIGHTLWVIADAAEIEILRRLFASVPCLYVADGHHRAAAAARHAQLMRARHPGSGGNAPFESFMAVAFAHHQVRILAYNRVVEDLNGLTVAQFLAKVAEGFVVRPGAAPSPSAQRNFAMFLDGRWYGLEAKPGSFAHGDPVASLDASLLQDELLAPVLGITSPRSDKRIDFVGGIRGADELERRCREGAAVAFALFPPALSDVLAVADAGRVMPPKSTWFEPKLRSGLTVRTLDA